MTPEFKTVILKMAYQHPDGIGCALLTLLAENERLQDELRIRPPLTLSGSVGSE